jgi:hypothetical protein
MSSIPFTLRTVVPTSIIVFGLVAVFASASGLATSALLLVIIGLVVPVMTLLLWKGTAHPTIAKPGLQPLDVAMVGGGLRRRRGPSRRDEGRLYRSVPSDVTCV